MRIIILLILIFYAILCFAGCDKTNISHQKNDIPETSIINNTQNTAPLNEENILLSVLHNEKFFITEKGQTVYLREYKPFYKLSEDIDYYEKDNVFVPRDYTFVDLDKNGNKELIVAESPYADTYLILRKENEKIYGYSLYIRWFQTLKSDGTFLSSGGAVSHNYNTINFHENKYKISTFATFDFVGDDKMPSSNKYGFEPDYEKSVFEIDGKKVSFEKIVEFAEEWDKRPNAEWIEFN